MKFTIKKKKKQEKLGKKISINFKNIKLKTE